MNAAELQVILNKLSLTIDHISGRSLNSDAAVRDLHALRDVLCKLDNYWIEIQKAETQADERVGAPTLVDVGNVAERLDAIEKRLREIERTAKLTDEQIGVLAKDLEIRSQ